MTLQQLRYVIAVNKYRNFAKAAEACSVTQPTLSAMLMKLEEELGIRIFERTNKSVVPSITGEKIISIAEKTLANAESIHNVISEEEGRVSGELRLSVAPTIAPYILPDFISKYTAQYPHVKMWVKDMKVSSIINALIDGSIDVGIGIAGSTRKGIKEIPLYTEKIELYASPKVREDGNEFLWVMKEALSLRENTYNFYNANKGHHIYEATSVDQLIRMVDQEGGFTMIPHMHLRYLTNEQRKNVVVQNPEEASERKVSIYVRSAITRKNVLDSIIAVLQQIIPSSMIEPGIKNLE